MSYREEVCCETTPGYFVQPVPTVVYQTVGNCPACHVRLFSN